MEKYDQAFGKTDRLILRRFSINDTKYFHFYRSNTEVAKFQSWDNYQYHEAKTFVNEQINNNPNQRGTWFQFAIALAENNKMIGDCALHTLLSEPHIVEIGFTISTEYQGNGYATEAICTLLHYIFHSLGKHKVIAFSDVRNNKSISVLERVGMRREGQLLQNYMLKGQWIDEYQYSILKSEWKNATYLSTSEVT
ncbi:ribosomal-protein-serine acetyltransferase [Bacillus mycoides]|uniref:GNAT family N-acetyltransferase n=1 Tax=Bacillus TaxID=1386 RepID=UPI0008FEA386|nr:MULTISPECIES: GNAT family protein [Bacillus]MED1512660.1 GNAT family protein [Bacillus proteolyticus]OJD69955.1 ribosomal-protein-serine acetyltransferase [Bacillus sp. NH11B]GLV65920.1 ribosomal-protein-serine acetyltransferase [Bacillus mycoides]